MMQDKTCFVFKPHFILVKNSCHSCRDLQGKREHMGFFKASVLCVINPVTSMSTKSWSFLQTSRKKLRSMGTSPKAGLPQSCLPRKEIETPWITKTAQNLSLQVHLWRKFWAAPKDSLTNFLRNKYKLLLKVTSICYFRNKYRQD